MNGIIISNVSNLKIEGCTIHPSNWIRACSRCNGPIYTGEGQYIPSQNYGNRHFMVHKTVALCKERQDLRVLEDKMELMNMPEMTVADWYKQFLQKIATKRG